MISTAQLNLHTNDDVMHTSSREIKFTKLHTVFAPLVRAD